MAGKNETTGQQLSFQLLLQGTPAAASQKICGHTAADMKLQH
jgi:hypothetical protein